MEQLARENRQRVVDLLSERLACARVRARLQEAALVRVASSDDALVRRGEGWLARIRAQVCEHASWLERCLASLGASEADPPRARVARARLEGIVAVALDPASSLGDVVDSLLAAALLDHSGWNVLIGLAAEVDDGEAQAQLRERLDQVNQHLHALRTLVLAIERRALTGVLTDVARKAA